MKLSIGPIQYFWDRQRVLDFYKQAADSPAEIIYLGEVICSKRRQLNLEDWMAIGNELQQDGKEVILSSLTLLEAASEMSSLKKLCQNESLLAAKGLKRWVLPVELGLDTLKDLQELRPEGLETEVFAFGRLPLAYSARCYTARSHNLPKDDCQFKCIEYPDGRMLATQEDQEFLVLNGIQTQSALTHHVLQHVPELRALGVDVLRISPQYSDTMRVIDIFNIYLNNNNIKDLSNKLLELLPLGACNGYAVEQAGMDYESQQIT
jgi:collagenase-like PrtC family protease